MPDNSGKEKEAGKILNSLSTVNSIIKNKIDELKKDGDPSLVSILFELFVSIYFDNDESAKYWESVVNHRKIISDKLKRDVDLRVAILDYFLNVENMLKNPKIIEMELFEEVLRASKEDPKTGLYNNKYFIEALKNEMNRAKRNSFELSLIFLDLDDFKGVNDKYGHMVGDEILVHIAKIIKEMIRAEDVAARFGGDEFVIMLGHTDKAGANAVATKLVNAINSKPLKIDNKFDNEYRFGLSAGIASYPIDASDPEELVEKADIALYHAKKIGKNNVFCYEHSKEDENIPKNRRIADRYDCKLEEIYFNLLNSKNKYKAFLKNISESGFQIQTPFINPSMQGNWMEIEINNERVNPFHITGKMLYSKKHDFGYIAGFKIDNLHRDEEKISAFIDVQKRKAI